MKRALTIGMIATVAAVATALVVSAIAVANAQAATFTATDTADLSDTHPGDGVCNSSAGTCTLRAAIEESNALGGTNTVQLLPGGAYDVNTWANPVVCEGTYPWILCNCEGSVAYPGLDITSHVNITVAGSRTGGPTFAPGNPRTSEPTPATIAITARPSFNDPFSLDCYTTWSTFRIEAAANVTFNDLIIRGGCACFDHFGGAIKNAGALTLTNTTLASNTASSGGGAIYSTGTTLISRSSIGGGNNAPLGGGS